MTTNDGKVTHTSCEGCDNLDSRIIYVECKTCCPDRAVKGERKNYLEPAPVAGQDSVEAERSALRELQTNHVMPLIGDLLDRWDSLPNDVKSDSDLDGIAKIIKEIDNGMEGDTQIAPVATPHDCLTCRKFKTDRCKGYIRHSSGCEGWEDVEIPAPVAGQDATKNALREAMKYVESTDGTRGELVGCAVNALTYLEWVRILNQPTAQDIMDALEDEGVAKEIADTGYSDDLCEFDCPTTAIRRYRDALKERLQKGTP
jgi:hypothetical protein